MKNPPFKLFLSPKTKLSMPNNSKQTLSNKPSFSQENMVITQRSNNLNEYYQSLRDNMITLLEHVRLPNASGAPQEKMGHENFDSYFTKLQTLCTADGYCADETQRPIYETVKTALQDFTVLPTPI